MSLDRVLDKCLHDIQAGKATVDGCLARYPDVAGELEPLLHMAAEIMATPAVRPSPLFVKATRERLLKLPAPETAPGAIRPGLSPQRWLSELRALWPTWQRRQAFVGVMAFLLAVVLIGGGTVVASAQSMPDHPLYPIKRVVENARLRLALSPATKAILHVEFAYRRLTEAVVVAEKGQPEQAKHLIQEYGSELLSAVGTLEDAAAQGTSVSQISSELRGRVAGQQMTVENARAALPSDAVNSALGVTQQVDAALTELTRGRPGQLPATASPTPTATHTPRPRITVPPSVQAPTSVPPTQRPRTEMPKATPSLLLLPTPTQEPYTEPPKLTPIILGATDTPAPPTTTPRPSTPTPILTPAETPPLTTPSTRPPTPTASPIPDTVTPRAPTPTGAVPTLEPSSTYQTPVMRPPTPADTTEPPAAPATSTSPAAERSPTPAS